jgi:hypothetical protein
MSVPRDIDLAHLIPTEHRYGVVYIELNKRRMLRACCTGVLSGNPIIIIYMHTDMVRLTYWNRDSHQDPSIRFIDVSYRIPSQIMSAVACIASDIAQDTGVDACVDGVPGEPLV